MVCLINYKTSVYLSQQASGQLSVLMNTIPISEYRLQKNRSRKEIENIDLVEQIKKYSVDSLNYKATKNFTSVYGQNQSPTLWVITACAPFAFKPYEWQFPIVGKVTYKGFFKKSIAQAEYHRLKSQGYDVDLRNASAWSTLGWFNDPVLSTMLNRKKGSLCNLLFHELFHATYYAPGSVDLNENLANFIAHKATILFLKDDLKNLSVYLDSHSDNRVFSHYMLRKRNELENFYEAIKKDPNKQNLKLREILKITDSVSKLPLYNKIKFENRRPEMLRFKNAYFVDFQQYESMQDSLELVFNKIYKGKLKNLVRDLKLNKINY